MATTSASSKIRSFLKCQKDTNAYNVYETSLLTYKTIIPNAIHITLKYNQESNRIFIPFIFNDLYTLRMIEKACVIHEKYSKNVLYLDLYRPLEQHISNYNGQDNGSELFERNWDFFLHSVRDRYSKVFYSANNIGQLNTNLLMSRGCVLIENSRYAVSPGYNNILPFIVFGGYFQVVDNKLKYVHGYLLYDKDSVKNYKWFSKIINMNFLENIQTYYRNYHLYIPKEFISCKYVDTYDTTNQFGLYPMNSSKSIDRIKDIFYVEKALIPFIPAKHSQNALYSSFYSPSNQDNKEMQGHTLDAYDLLSSQFSSVYNSIVF